MGTAGTRVVNAEGKAGVLPSGKAAVADASGNCPTCCDVQLTDCEDDTNVKFVDDANTDFSAVTATSWADLGGQVVEISGSDKCWKVESGSGTVESVTVDETHASCSACLDCTCGDCTFNMSQNLLYTFNRVLCQFDSSGCSGNVIGVPGERLNSGNPVTFSPTNECGKWEALDVTEEDSAGIAGQTVCEVDWTQAYSRQLDFQIKWDCQHNRWFIRERDAGTTSWGNWESFNVSNFNPDCDGFDASFVECKELPDLNASEKEDVTWILEFEA